MEHAEFAVQTSYAVQVAPTVPSQQLINGKLWICKVDKKRNKPYYFEKELKKAQWETPAGWVDETVTAAQ